MFSFNLATIFLFFGFDFKRRDNPWIRIVSHVLKLKSIAIFIYNVIDSTIVLFTTSYITKRELSTITITIKCYLTLISFLVFIRKFPRFFDIEEKIQRNLSDKSLKSSKLINSILILFLVILISINLTCSFIVVLLFYPYNLIYYIIFWIFNNLTWLLLVQFLFLKIIYEIHLIEQELFQKYHQDLQNRKEIHNKDFQAKFELLISLKHSINTDLGPLIFLYLANQFQSTCFRLSFLTLNASLDISQILLLMIEFTSQVIVSLIMIYLVNYCQSKRPSQIDITKIVRNSSSPLLFNMKFDYFDSIMINKIIETYCKLDYSPCYMFDINQKFLLHYFSTVITFTVMLASIIDQFLK